MPYKYDPYALCLNKLNMIVCDSFHFDMKRNVLESIGPLDIIHITLREMFYVPSVNKMNIVVL